ncbi:MAG TPA: hypothetical protein VJG32_04545 [Anaerolineae bacterium]|nr:hypothetical protein [Anaerolineae bacterium]
MIGGGLFMVLFWVVLIVAAVWLANGLLGARPRSVDSSSPNLGAKEILNQRFARGEVTREQYDLMKQDLQ